MRWLIPEHDSQAVAELARELGVRRLTAETLISRGLRDPAAARRFLAPSLQHLHDPHLLAGMPQALERLRAAIARREKILIYGDYDVDGTISVVLLMKAIELAGGAAQFHVPHRLKEGYGMRPEAIERAAADGVTLIISVDTGIRALEVVGRARELGVDVIVTDHHLPEAELPAAVAVLNPNRPDCSYPEKGLCGAGVAFKLAHALLASLGWPAARLERMLLSFLKLVAIATVADVVPLVGENRVIVKFGLEGLDRVRNIGLRALMEVSGVAPGDAPSAREVAFQIAPRINAAGRMAHAEDVIHLFLTPDLERARDIAGQLQSLNQERQRTEAEVVREILEECARTPVTLSEAALVFAGANWHRGVLGIVASRLVERFGRPTFVLGEQDGALQGSGRSIPGFHLLNALESMPGLFTRFGGHRQAAGVALAAERLEDFRTRLNDYARERLTPQDFEPRLEIDAYAEFADLTGDAAEELLKLAPFGFGNPTPLLALRGAQICGSAAPFKDKHLRVQFGGAGPRVLATAWNFAERCSELTPGARVDIALCVEEDAYAAARGWPGWRTVLKDVRPCALAQSGT